MTKGKLYKGGHFEFFIDTNYYDLESYIISINEYMRCNNDKPGWIWGEDLEENYPENNVSHVIKDIFIYDDQVRGYIDILNTPRGEVVKQLLEFDDLYIEPRMITKYNPSTKKYEVHKIISFNICYIP